MEVSWIRSYIIMGRWNTHRVALEIWNCCYENVSLVWFIKDININYEYITNSSFNKRNMYTWSNHWNPNEKLNFWSFPLLLETRAPGLFLFILTFNCSNKLDHCWHWIVMLKLLCSWWIRSLLPSSHRRDVVGIFFFSILLVFYWSSSV